LGRQTIFDDWRMAAIAARALANRELWRDARLCCWVLMPDHWHAMIQLFPGAQLSAVVRRARVVSARAVNQARRADGAVWAKAFHDRALRDDESVVDAARHVVANPVRAGLARSVREYPFWDAMWLDTRSASIEGRMHAATTALPARERTMECPDRLDATA
jgi:REP element-mobilizing transposase RayT